MPRPPVSVVTVFVNIDSPANGATFTGPTSGVPIRVTGSASAFVRSEDIEEDVPVTKVEVSVGDGGYQLATPNDGDWSVWSYDGIITTTGSVKITAKATLGGYGTVRTKTDSITVWVQADNTAPNLDATAPGTVQGEGPTFPVMVTGTASDSQTGVRSIDWSLNGQNFYPATALSNGWANWQAAVTLPGLGRHTITVRAIDNANNVTTRSVVVTAIDTIAPKLQILSPQDNATITGTDNGITLDVTGTASDALTGIRTVEWAVDGSDRYQAATPQAPGNWSTWSAKVLIPSPGIHKIAVRTFDQAGNSFASTITVNIALPFEVRDPNDIVSPVAYLADLLDFATRRIKVSQTGKTITQQLLVETFYQPFSQLLKTEKRAIANQPVHQIRLCIEVLRQYLAAHPNSSAPQMLVQAEGLYRRAAYQTLLNKLGTSYEEIRLARIADEPTRKRLADQLGITPVNQLDRLFMPLEQVSEAALEQFFGLPNTTQVGVDRAIAPTPELLTLQTNFLKQVWEQQDEQTSDQIPMIDPDRMVVEDLKDAIAGNPAYDLWQTRKQWLSNQRSALKAQREAKPNPVDGFTAIVTPILGSIETLAQWLELRRQGKSIDAQLQAQSIRLDAFLHLMQIYQLAKSGTVLETEWRDLYAILVQVQKRRVYPEWFAIERQKKLTLSPDYFTLTDEPIDLPTWRTTAADRQQWVDTLTARIKQQQGLVESWQALIDDTEAATLPLLRDGVLGAIAAGPVTADLTNELSQQLAIDVQSSGTQKTTRILQAIETLQAMLFALRTGQFEEPDSQLPPSPAAFWEMNLTPDYQEEQFDREWQWMGTYATWRAAMFVFGYPENLLLPSLREVHNPGRPQDPTPAFQDLVDQIRNTQALTPQQARDAAQQYLNAIKTSMGANWPADLQGFQLTDRRSEKDLQELAVRARRLFGTTQLPNIPVYLKEIFYFVPLQLALQLQKSGQYLTALDWFQTVYAYNLPVVQRKIYPGLVLEEGLATEYRRTINWLLDSLNPHDIAATRANAYTRFTLMSLVRCLLEFADSEFTRDTNESIPRARSLYMLAADLLELPEMQPPDNAQIPFPPNPVVQSLQLHAELSLLKLRQGRNIAGMERQVEGLVPTQPLSDLPTVGTGGQLVVSRPVSLKPTPYYYAVLIERAKQLVSIAQQIEAAYLSALEKRDAEAYNQLKAGQDLRLAGATVQLQDLRVNEAMRGISLAQVQQQRSQVLRDTYQGWLTNGLSNYEQKILDSYKEAKRYRNWIAGVDAALTTAQAITTAASASFGFGAALASAGAVSVLAATKAGLSIGLNDAETRSQTYSLLASFERRSQEWQLQKSLAEKDIEIGAQQIALAVGQARVVGQERTISQMQADHAQAVVDFLSNKFTNAELYDWMSGILGGVYSYFLQQATAVAQLAQTQLAFERQEVPPSYIQADYWQAPSETGLSGEQSRDRRGMTGSARLLQDIYQLDQYAFETNKRKLQLTQTLSLAQLFPYEFQQFRETGKLTFATPMELFDRAFPGHYLRLIKRVRTSVLALIPPTQGIRATLMTSGVSRVVIGGNQFQTVVVRRNPELVALTSPQNATGVFELDAQSDLLLPFEGMGVDTLWEFQLPKAANPFDYRTISDVLITVEYTALHSFDYQQQVIRSFRPEVSSDRAFSLRDQFPDAWYKLHNAPSNQPIDIDFQIAADDFPSTFSQVKIQHLTLYVVSSAAAPTEITVNALTVKQGDRILSGQTITSVDGIISTRRPSAGWSMLRNQSPVGQWQMVLSSPDNLNHLFQDSVIEDLILVVTYSATPPSWNL